MDRRRSWHAAPIALALCLAMPEAPHAATTVHVVDQFFTFNEAQPGSQLPGVPIGEGHNAQSFIPRLNNVSFAFFWSSSGTWTAKVDLEHLATGSRLASAPLSQPDGFPFGLRKGLFASPVAVTPGATYSLVVKRDFPIHEVVPDGTGGSLQAFSPGGYQWGRGTVSGMPRDGLDFYFIEGGVIEQLPSTGTLLPAPGGTMRFTTRSVSGDPSTQTRWQHPAIGGARFHLTGTQEGHFTTGFDRGTNKASTKFELLFKDNANGVADAQTLGVSLTDTVTLDNPTDEDKTVLIGGLFDAAATFAAGSNPNVTMLLFVDGQARSSGRSYTAGADADIAQSVTPFSVVVPRRSTRTVETRQDVFIAAPEGSSIAAGNSLTIDFTLPEGVTMTSLLAAPVPEPETYTMMFIGLGIVVLQLRRRHLRDTARGDA